MLIWELMAVMILDKLYSTATSHFLDEGQVDSSIQSHFQPQQILKFLSLDNLLYCNGDESLLARETSGQIKKLNGSLKLKAAGFKTINV